MKVAALFVHPIKSCGAIPVAEARVTARGLEHDRRWMVVDGDGQFLTQRTLPEMALVRVAIHDERLVVSREGLPRLPLPFVHDDGERVEVVVWDDRVRAVVHEAGSDWFSRALERDVRLVCMPDEAQRPVDAEYARAGDVVSFADGFPLLVVNEASLAALGGAVDARRFRPNLVVTGAAAWAEDEWRALAVGAPGGPTLTLRTPKPCARCTIPGIDPDSAVTTKEPLRTLARLRTRDHRVLFGVNAIPDGEGLLRVGDSVAPVDM
ncbi:MAG TPA: MOSC N-terminal beta barrel domain-containing protein [Polyangia bacterium]